MVIGIYCDAIVVGRIEKTVSSTETKGLGHFMTDIYFSFTVVSKILRFKSEKFS